MTMSRDETTGIQSHEYGGLIVPCYEPRRNRYTTRAAPDVGSRNPDRTRSAFIQKMVAPERPRY